MPKKLIQRIDWPIATFLTVTPLVSVIGVPLLIYHEGFSWLFFGLLFPLVLLGNFGITAGYHRLFAHRSYDANPMVKFLLILFGTATFEGSVLKWAADHRQHHLKEDTDEDPYSINKGFWYAHIGWLYLSDSTNPNPKAPDLEKSAFIRWQHRNYSWFCFVVGFGIPTLCGYWAGSALYGFLVWGVLRTVLTQHFTFFINSICHMFGKQTYSDEVTARDSGFIAFLTNGEGYHNFHHKFQVDYRNGIRWFQYDPTKWFIQTCKTLGLAWNLKQAPAEEILKARLLMEEKRLSQMGHANEALANLKVKILSAQDSLKRVRIEIQRLKQKKKDEFLSAEVLQNIQERIRTLQVEWRLAKIEFEAALEKWRTLLRNPQFLHAMASTGNI